MIDRCFWVYLSACASLSSWWILGLEARSCWLCLCIVQEWIKIHIPLLHSDGEDRVLLMMLAACHISDALVRKGLRLKLPVRKKYVCGFQDHAGSGRELRRALNSRRCVSLIGSPGTPVYLLSLLGFVVSLAIYFEMEGV